MVKYEVSRHKEEPMLKYTKKAIPYSWTNGDLNPGPFTIAAMRSENHTPRPFARQIHYG